MRREPHYICRLAPVFCPMLEDLIFTSHAESRYDRFAPLSMTRLRGAMQRAMHDKNYCAWVALTEDASRLVGILYVYRQQYLFSEEWFANDLFFYILPDFRGRTIASGLLRCFDEWCTENGCVQMMVSTTSGIERDKVARFLRIKGYEHVGSNLAKDIVVRER